jgi:uncharacterized protein (UPF0332 family)
MFHVARAVLFKDGIEERSHACVPVYLKGNYDSNKEGEIEMETISSGYGGLMDVFVK